MTAFNRRETAPFITEGFLSRPGGPGYADEKARGPLSTVGRAFSAARTAIAEYFRRQQVVAELSTLTDRELADIGLSRSDIGQIFTPEFAARHNAERFG